jgi:hypothetical protein
MGHKWWWGLLLSNMKVQLLLRRPLALLRAGIRTGVPTAWMTDFSFAEINAIESNFPGKITLFAGQTFMLTQPFL